VAHYLDNFNTPGQLAPGWQFLWNAPTGWVAGGYSGVETTNPLGNSQTPYLALLPTPTGTVWTPSGGPPSSPHEPDGFLQLGSVGGQVFGSPGFGSRQGQNTVERYAIAAFTLLHDGIYAIDQSSLTVSNSSPDGIDVRVFVNSTEINTPSVVRAANTADFDRNLGYRRKGDVVYVAFGPGTTDAHDVFTNLDYQIVQLSSTETVAQYRHDFGGVANPYNGEWGWRYLWNGPTGGDLTSGALTNSTDPNTYQQLAQVSGSNPLTLTPSGDASYSHIPDGNLRLTQGSGFPGQAEQQLPNGPERFAIAAFTVHYSGLYELTHSSLSLVNGSGSRGVDVRVLDRNGHWATVVGSGTGGVFDHDLGFLNQKDTVFVAVGAAGGSDANDEFTWDFQLDRVVPRVTPLRAGDLSPNNYRLVDLPSGGDDAPAVRRAIADAVAHQQANPNDVSEVLFPPPDDGQPPHTYRLGTPASDDPWHVVTAFGCPTPIQNLIIHGNGATLLITDPKLGLFNIGYAQNVIFENFTIDYETLPFSQGRIVALDPNDPRKFTLQKDPGYPDPTGATFMHATSKFGYPVDTSNPGRPLVRAGLRDGYNPDDTNGIQSTGVPGQFIITLTQGETTTGLMPSMGQYPGDHFVLRAAYYSIPLADYSNYPNASPPFLFNTLLCGQVTLSGITAYAGPATAVVGTLDGQVPGLAGGGGVNVLGCNFVVKPNSDRLISVDGDGVYMAGDRVGPWIENSRFVGLADDALDATNESWQVPDAMMGQAQTTFQIPLPSSTFAPYVMPGDHLTFWNPGDNDPHQNNPPRILARVRVVSVQTDWLHGTFTYTVDQAVTGIRYNPTYPLSETQVFDDDLSPSTLEEGCTARDGRSAGARLLTTNFLVVDNIFKYLEFQGIVSDPVAFQIYGEGLRTGGVAQGNTIDYVGYDPGNLDNQGAIVFQLRDGHDSVINDAATVNMGSYVIDNLWILNNEITVDTAFVPIGRAFVVQNVQTATYTHYANTVNGQHIDGDWPPPPPAPGDPGAGDTPGGPPDAHQTKAGSNPSAALALADANTPDGRRWASGKAVPNVSQDSGGPPQVPGFAQVDFAGQAFYAWAGATGGARAPQQPAGGPTPAAAGGDPAWQGPRPGAAAGDDGVPTGYAAGRQGSPLSQAGGPEWPAGVLDDTLHAVLVGEYMPSDGSDRDSFWAYAYPS
jgi:hypothetical protein